MSEQGETWQLTPEMRARMAWAENERNLWAYEHPGMAVEGEPAFWEMAKKQIACAHIELEVLRITFDGRNEPSIQCKACREYFVPTWRVTATQYVVKAAGHTAKVQLAAARADAEALATLLLDELPGCWFLAEGADNYCRRQPPTWELPPAAYDYGADWMYYCDEHKPDGEDGLRPYTGNVAAWAALANHVSLAGETTDGN